jgi:uncharacterized protein (TIGR02145 family)
MQRIISFCLIAFFLIHNINAQPFGTMKDTRDGKVYKTVKIGEQVWMAENLKAEFFRNCDTIYDMILYPTLNHITEKGEVCLECWSHYNNDHKTGNDFGKLYNIQTVLHPEGLAPEGWRIPTRSDFEKLIKHLGGIKKIESKLKSKIGWPENENGENSSGFNGLPGGKIEYNGKSYSSINLGEAGYWWTSDLNAIVDTIWIFKLSNEKNGIGIDIDSHHNWLSVRCIKN